MNAKPKTLQQAIKYYSNPDTCIDFIVSRRWPNGVECPTCGRKDVRFISTRRMWECKDKHPKRQFSVKVGTIFEDSAIPLDKWLIAIWMIANCENGVSSYEIGRALGITQKSAWFMLHRIRLAMQNQTFVKMGGPGSEVEVDETFVGGAARFVTPINASAGLLRLAPRIKSQFSASWNVAARFALRSSAIAKSTCSSPTFALV